MPGIGGLSIANNLLANSASLNLNRNQAALGTAVTRLSSGLRINTAADDPSGGVLFDHTAHDVLFRFFRSAWL